MEEMNWEKRSSAPPVHQEHSELFSTPESSALGGEVGSVINDVPATPASHFAETSTPAYPIENTPPVTPVAPITPPASTGTGIPASDVSADHGASIEDTLEMPAFYREHIGKPKRKERKKLTSRSWFLCLTSALLSALLCLGGMMTYLHFNPIDTKNDSAARPSSVIQTDPSDLEDLNALPTTTIAQQVSPSVVSIQSTVHGYTYFNIPTTGQSTGSGIIISSDGYIITNNHVVENSSDISVTLNNGEKHEAKLIGTDPDTDLAVIKVDAVDLPAATLGDSDALMVGERAIAIGNPISTDLAGTVTQGIISALDRSITVEGVTYHLIQIDAAINAGNSGGALVNQYGQVIGINSVKIATEGVEGLGFAIPINDAKPVIEDLMDYGYVKGRPLIGLSLRELNPDLARYNNLLVEEGLYVTEVTEGSAAEAAGIQRGDIVLACEGTKVTTVAELNELRDQHKAGDTITLTINRAGTERDIRVILGEKKPTFTQDTNR